MAYRPPLHGVQNPFVWHTEGRFPYSCGRTGGCFYGIQGDLYAIQGGGPATPKYPQPWIAEGHRCGILALVPKKEVQNNRTEDIWTISPFNVPLRWACKVTKHCQKQSVAKPKTYLLWFASMFGLLAHNVRFKYSCQKICGGGGGRKGVHMFLVWVGHIFQCSCRFFAIVIVYIAQMASFFCVHGCHPQFSLCPLRLVAPPKMLISHDRFFTHD